MCAQRSRGIRASANSGSTDPRFSMLSLHAPGDPHTGKDMQPQGTVALAPRSRRGGAA